MVNFHQGSSERRIATPNDLVKSAMKATIQELYDNGIFDIYDTADEGLKDFLDSELNEWCRAFSGPPYFSIHMISFKDFLQKYKLWIEATSGKKIKHVMSSFLFPKSARVCVYLKEGPFASIK